MEELRQKFGLFVRLEAKTGKEDEVDQFLRGALPLAQAESGTVAWYALRMGPSTFAIFDTFNDEAGRQAHLTGKVAEALFAKAPELFSNAPLVEKTGILAEKLPS